jgi:hypothetical protein
MTSAPVICVFAALLVACSPAVDDLTSARAAHWLERTCGVRLSGEPAMFKGTESFSTAPHGVANFVHGTVQVPAAEWESVVSALSRADGIRKVKSPPEKQEYESFEGASDHRSCVLDHKARTLFFEFRD